MNRFGPERVDTPRRSIAALGQSHRTFARRLWRRSPGSIARLRHCNETWSHMTVSGLNAAGLMRHEAPFVDVAVAPVSQDTLKSRANAIWTHSRGWRDREVTIC